MSTKLNQIEPGYTQFFDNELPGLPAGYYEILAELSLPNADTNYYKRNTSQHFEVKGPQFGIDPAEIHAMFPADSANGDFSAVLPAITLENAVLPWERAITDDTKVPWVALLIFKADEVAVNPTTNSPVITTNVAAFLAPEPGVLKPDIPLNSISEEVRGGSMNSVRIRTDVFQAVTPRLQELAALTSVRAINPADQAVSGDRANPAFSVVMANRFPKSDNPHDDAGAINYAHLVSLEGLTDYLVDTPAWPEGVEKVQLVSLASWTFVSARQPGQTFAELATNLIAPEPDSMLLRIPAKDDGSEAAARLAMGYTALSYHTLPGVNTFAWYRGPFTAAPAQPLPADVTVYRHASAAIVYDQQYGVFDHSYGAAWSIGRLTALADPVFATAIQQVRNKVVALNARLLQRSKMVHLAHISDLKTLAAPRITQTFFTQQVKAGMGDALTQSFDTPPVERPVVQRMAEKSFLFEQEAMPAAIGAQYTWFMQQPKIGSFLVSEVEDDLDPLSKWLADLALLYNISFNHLVADQRMLPVESIRFFYIDQGWIRVLIDGAMSVGLHGTKEGAAQQVISGALVARTLEKTTAKRSQLLGVPQAVADGPKLPVAGMLLRSALVAGWPGLSVKATAGNDPVNVMRMDRIAPNVLLVLWDRTPDSVSLSQPEQGLIFGVDDHEVIARRSLEADNLGEQLPPPVFPASGNFSQYMRVAQNDIGGLVLNWIPAVNDTPGYLVPALSSALDRPANITAAQLAIELVKAPEEIVFNSPF